MLTKTTGTPHASQDAGYTALQGDRRGQQLDGRTLDRRGAVHRGEARGVRRGRLPLHQRRRADAPSRRPPSRATSADGGGFLGIHDAARLETGSSWFTQLVGARPNAGSPTATQQAIVEVQDKAHPAGKGMPTEWTVTDEWFNWAPNPAGNVHVVANLRERSYADKGTGANGWEHPISWCRDYDGGRSFYTGIGHTPRELRRRRLPQAPARRPALDRRALIRGNCKATIDASYTAERLTAPNNFTGITPESQLNQIGEPHGLDVDSKGRVFYIGRAAKGNLPPITNWTHAGRLARLGHRAPVRPEQAGRRSACSSTGDARRLRPLGRRRRADQEGRGPDRHRAGPELRHQQVRLPALHAVLEGRLRQAHRHAPRRPLHVRRGDGQARPELGEADHRVELPEPLVLPHGRRHGLRQGRQPLRPHRRHELVRATRAATRATSPRRSSRPAPAAGIGFNDARRTAGNTNDLNGKILRIKPHGQPGGRRRASARRTTIPAGNLFTGNETEAARPAR